MPRPSHRERYLLLRGFSLWEVRGVAAQPPLNDLVIRMRDGKIVLIRRIDNCTGIAGNIRASADVEQAECFK